MIRRLRIRGLGVIEEAQIPLTRGLTVVTGETGAGKTMILSGLALLGGARADFQSRREGVAAAEVEGTWSLGDPEAPVTRMIAEILAEAGGFVDTGPDGVELVVARILEEQGRSRAVAGGRTVPAGVLQEIAERLVAVHGQADQVRLRQAATHRTLLDRYAGVEHCETLTAYQRAFDEWREIATEVRDLLARRSVLDEESARLALGIADIEEVDPQPGEDEELDALAARLAHAGSLFEDALQARVALVGEELEVSDASVVRALDVAVRALDRIIAVDPSLADVAARLREIGTMAADAAADLVAYAEDLQADPTRQQAVEQRRASLRGLSRRYGGSISAVLEWLGEARAAVATAEGFDDHLAELRDRASRAHAQAQLLAEQVSAGRREAGQRLEQKVSVELNALAMPDARLEVRVLAEDPNRLGQWGIDAVEFLLAPHVGAPARPLGRGASGGELSRVMLALEVVLADADPVPTFIFDEVDAGIGGRAAIEVGRRLARLSRRAQVILVTHLPQVAAFADQHVVIEKSGNGGVTASSVRVVEGQDRIRELVRMLSGLAASEAASAHAEELLTLAEAERRSVVG